MDSSEEQERKVDYVLDPDFWEKGQALGFAIRFELVLKHLRQDMRDDWYFDCLQYDDLFKDPDEAKRIIMSLLQEGNGVYRGTRSVVRNIPKKGYGERYGLETDFFDRFVYQAICSFLIPFYDPLLGHRVLSYRHEPRPRNPKYLFKAKIERWFTFEGVTLTFRRSGRHLLITDLSNFYENVSRSQIVAALDGMVSRIAATGPEKLQIRNAIATLDRLLGKWTFSGDHGLPQNRDASAFLSNVLLSCVDREMTGRGYDYYRYVNDIPDHRGHGDPGPTCAAGAYQAAEIGWSEHQRQQDRDPSAGCADQRAREALPQPGQLDRRDRPDVAVPQPTDHHQVGDLHLRHPDEVHRGGRFADAEVPVRREPGGADRGLRSVRRRRRALEGPAGRAVAIAVRARRHDRPVL